MKTSVSFVLAILATAAVAQVPGTFTPVGVMRTGRAFHQAILLQDGRVLIVGGGTTAAELYDGATATFSAAGDVTPLRFVQTATLLDDGRVLIIGSESRAELYDPSTGTVSPAGDMVAQGGGTATLLKDGRVLITGAINPSDQPAIEANPQLFDPATNTFTLTGRFQSPGDGFFIVGAPNISAAVLLNDGRVLFAGEPTSEVYDPATGTFSLTGRMVTPCILGGFPMYISGRTATLLMSGKVLLTGGAHEDCGRFAEAELYDEQTGTFTLSGEMTNQRDNHAATLLADGRVLITGGETEACSGQGCEFSGTTTSAEIYDPATGTFSGAGDMIERRAGHTATRLVDGSVLITGGYVYFGIGAHSCCFSDAEIYSTPPHTRHRRIK